MRFFEMRVSSEEPVIQRELSSRVHKFHQPMIKSNAVKQDIFAFLVTLI